MNPATSASESGNATRSAPPLKQLPVAQREIIVLRDIEGFSYRELAEMLSCPMGTIMSRLARARAKFRNFW